MSQTNSKGYRKTFGTENGTLCHVTALLMGPGAG